MIALVKINVSVPLNIAKSFQSDLQLGVILLLFGSFPVNGEFTVIHPGSQSTEKPRMGMHNHGMSSGMRFLVGDILVTKCGKPNFRQKYSTIIKIVSRAGLFKRITAREKNNKAFKTLNVVETIDEPFSMSSLIKFCSAKKTTELPPFKCKKFLVNIILPHYVHKINIKWKNTIYFIVRIWYFFSVFSFHARL